MKYKVWNCKVIVKGDVALPCGFDFPPRRAVINCLDSYGIKIESCASGWGGTVSIEDEAYLEQKTKETK